MNEKIFNLIFVKNWCKLCLNVFFKARVYTENTNVYKKPTSFKNLLFVPVWGKKFLT